MRRIGQLSLGSRRAASPPGPRSARVRRGDVLAPVRAAAGSRRGPWARPGAGAGTILPCPQRAAARDSPGLVRGRPGEKDRGRPARERRGFRSKGSRPTLRPPGPAHRRSAGGLAARRASAQVDVLVAALSRVTRNRARRSSSAGRASQRRRGILARPAAPAAVGRFSRRRTTTWRRLALGGRPCSTAPFAGHSARGRTVFTGGSFAGERLNRGDSLRRGDSIHWSARLDRSRHLHGGSYRPAPWRARLFCARAFRPVFRKLFRGSRQTLPTFPASASGDGLAA